MQEPDALNNVAEFHRTFKHPILNKPQIPEEKRCQLRVALIVEELEELKIAIADKNIVEVADALCDIQYVLSGAILEFGLGEKFKALFEEVQRSNMSKSCNTLDEAEATVKYYRDNHNTTCHIVPSDGHYLVYRTEDQKTIKSINYSPADLTSILKVQ
jgi:predicted HAD superfamily Cof-like phosphohydrolase